MNHEDANPALLQSLPYDIILMILDYTCTPDVIRFGNTCKQFNELVKNSQSLWKTKLRNTVNRSVYGEIDKNTDGNWYNEMNKYSNLKSEIHSRIIDMAAYYYNCNNDISLDDVRQFFNNSFSNGLAYYCTVDILQELLRNGNKNIFMRIAKKPFTLTEMYYSKVAVRHLIHSYLTIKWVQAHVRNELPPEIILNFFLQWVDPLRMHTDDEVNDAIQSITNMVDIELRKLHPSKSLSARQMCAKGEITDAQIIAAISHVMYKQKRMTPLSVANLETLDIIRVVEMGCGHDVVIAAIYHAVAKKFGVQCELIAFPNHLFLELRGLQDGTNQQIYKIELDTGKLSPKRTCPFSRSYALPNSYKYCPDSLLQFVISSFLMPMGSYKTWYMQNAIYLLDFLSTNPNTDNSYKNYLPYLLDHTHLPSLATTIDVRCLTDEHLKIIALLSYLTKSPPPTRSEVVVNKRRSDLKYAVGMIVQHKVFEYVCVIRGWELTSRDVVFARPETRSLQFGTKQPFYIVVAIDQSSRYIAQEHLVDVWRPSRLYHLEDIIAKEFTHFNGFAYEPNALKQEEYPDDMAVSAQYRTRASTLYGPEPTVAGRPEPN